MDGSIDRSNSPWPPVSVAAMPQLVELRDPGDDWTGVTSTAERKKRQNRLNQRAYRRRKHVLQGDIPKPSSEPRADEEVQSQEVHPRHKIDNDAKDNTTSDAGYVLIPCPKRRAKVRALTQRAYQEYNSRVPWSTHLQLLIRLNALNAVMQNAIALGFAVEGLCHDDAISQFNAEGPTPLNTPTSFSSSPECLHPTALQMTVRHHPWIDLFPFPKMRDNMLRGIEAGWVDEDELCDDLLEVEDDNQGEKASLLIWGQSWDSRAWEASVAFLRKWGWLVRESPELLQATNHWRMRRGEKPLHFPTVLN